MLRSRVLSVAIVAVSGVVAVGAVAAVLGPDGTPVDGRFVLDEPGVYSQPSDDINDDSSGELLPDVVLADASGAPVTFEEYRGTPLVVNFWFSRCAPCRRELRDFATVHAELGGAVRFVGVDPFDTVDAMLDFARERGVTYDLLRDTGEHDDRLLTDELGLIGYPVTLFVDADGRILRQTGELDASQLRETIEELL